MNQFHSARLKLTGFYFAVLLVFCLLLTFGVRAFTAHELKRGDDAQRGAVHNLVLRYFDGPDTDPSPMPGDRFFANAQHQQYEVTRQNLNHDFLVLNIGLLAIGAVLSYWYAGRTLRPIEAAHEEQKRFTADASHELRTPLASMRLENEVFLRQKTFKEKEARDLIASNLEEVARLERLATNLLALNQYEQGSVVKHPADVQTVVADAIERTKRADGAARIDFASDVQAATIVVDQESVVELVGILLDNAVKYGPKKGAVTVTGVVSEHNYTLQVRDHGPGVDPEDLPHIFERMYRGDKARSSKVSGHGIGLSLAEQIAHANGATLTAANHAEGGAVFTLVLPQ